MCSMLTMVTLCSGDFKLYSDTSSIMPHQLVIKIHALEWVCVEYLGDFLQVEKWRILRSMDFASNCFKLGKTFTETFQMLQQAYGEDCLSHTQCHEWYQHFISGRTSTEDDPKSGRPSMLMDNDHVEKVLAVIRQKHCLSVCEVTKEVGICKSSCHLILTDKLKMRRVVTKFVPHLLTDAQKENHVTVSQELLDRSNADENFLKNVITDDETWVYSYDGKTKV